MVTRMKYTSMYKEYFGKLKHQLRRENKVNENKVISYCETLTPWGRGKMAATLADDTFK